MQRYGTDSPRTPPASSDPGPDGGRGEATDQDSVSLSEHQRAIEAERKRQSGQTRAFEREKTRLERQVEELQRALRERTAPSIPQAEPLLSRIPENDPVREVLGELINNQRTYGEFVNSDYAARTAAETARALSEAVKASGVPEAWLDEWLDDNGLDLSAQNLRLAGREYRREAEFEALKAQLSGAREDAEGTETRVREELGASKPFTATGRPPVGRTVDDQIREADEVIAELESPRTKMDREQRMTLLPRARALRNTLTGWKAAGNRGKHPNYD
jgi:hypothetical protein